MTEIEDIIKGCKNSDPKAMGSLYKIYSSRLFGVCLRYSKSRWEAEDVLHESFIKIYKSFKNFNGGKQSLEAWLKKITVYTAIDNFKKDKSHSLISFSDQSDEPVIIANEFEASLAHDLSAEEILKIVTTLPEGYRIIFNLYVIEGFTHKEISETLNISEGTSKSQLFKAKKQIKKLLSQYKLSNDGFSG